MKEKILVLFLILALPLFSPGLAYAGAQASKDVITKEKLPDLVLDITKEPLLYKIVPRPTPVPTIELISNPFTKGSWTKSPYKILIEKAARDYNIDPQVIYATIMTESSGAEDSFRFEPAINDASLCLGQILISTARRLGFKGEPKELYNPAVCINLIGSYHRTILDQYGPLTPLQLARAYNTGSPWKTPVRGHLFRFKMWLYEES